MSIQQSCIAIYKYLRNLSCVLVCVCVPVFPAWTLSSKTVPRSFGRPIYLLPRHVQSRPTQIWSQKARTVIQHRFIFSLVPGGWTPFTLNGANDFTSCHAAWNGSGGRSPLTPFAPTTTDAKKDRAEAFSAAWTVLCERKCAFHQCHRSSFRQQGGNGAFLLCNGIVPAEIGKIVTGEPAGTEIAHENSSKKSQFTQARR